MRRRFFSSNSIIQICLSIIFYGSFLTAQAQQYFTDTFNTPPVLASSQTAGTWYPDRYRPAVFEQYNFSGENVLHVGIRLADALLNRPPANQSIFSNTHGRKFDLDSSNGFSTALIADLYVGADWGTKHRMATLWSTACDSAGATSFFNIFGFRNTTGSNPGFYVYGIQNSGAYTLLPFTITYGQWYSVRIELTDTAFVYSINGAIVLSDTTLNGTKYFSNLMLQAYSFADSTSPLPIESQAFDEYDVYWDNVGAVDTGVPLPVELVVFTAMANRTNAELRWSTATEVDNYGFEVERKTLDNEQSTPPRADAPIAETENWNNVGFVEGAGTSNIPKEYFFSDKNISSGKYSYRLKQIDRDGKFTYSPSAEVIIGEGPQKFGLFQNYPNPFNPATTFSFNIPSKSFASLKIFDALGREVSVVLSEELPAGMHFRQWNAADLPGGVYFYRLVAGLFTETRKFLLLK